MKRQWLPLPLLLLAATLSAADGAFNPTPRMLATFDVTVDFDRIFIGDSDLALLPCGSND